MSTPPAILNKVKLLLNLAKSPNENEASNAQAMADKLISKYNITEDELASLEDKVFYDENDILFSAFYIVSWQQQLALAVANYFDCQIVLEELVPGQGLREYKYFVYGDDDQVKDTQFVYHALAKKVDSLVDTKCWGRGGIFIESYREGIVDSIKNNIQNFGIDLPEIKSTLKPEQQAAPPTSQTLTKTSPSEKEEPTDKRVDISKQSFVKDVMAYFKGVDDGKYISLKDVLELEAENEKTKEIPAVNPTEESKEDFC